MGFIIFAVSQPAFPFLLDYFIQVLDNKGNSLNIPFLGNIDYKYLIFLIPMGVIAIAVTRGIGTFLGNYFLAKVSFGLIHDIRTALFSHLLRLPCTYFDKNTSGSLVSIVTYNVTQLATAATDALRTTVREGLTVIALIVYLLMSDWKLTLAFIFIGPIIVFIVIQAGKKFRKVSVTIQNSMGDVTQVASEYISGYKTTRIFGAEDHELNRFKIASANNSNQSLKLVRLASIHTPLLQILVLSTIAFFNVFFVVSSQHQRLNNVDGRVNCLYHSCFFIT